MEMFSSAVVAELVNRSMSFLLAKCKKQATAVTVQEDLDLLRRLLMRSDTIIEEAEWRHVSNPDMLQQLKALRDKTYRGYHSGGGMAEAKPCQIAASATGYHVLDTVRCRALLGGGSRGGDGEHKEEKEEVKRRMFALSRFNPAKRVRFPSDGDDSGSEPTVALNDGVDDAGSRELHQVVCSLEALIGGMDEFVVLLMSCPPLYRQPYSIHLSLDRCMFGRNMEKETVMEFLLQTEPPASAGNLGVLPIFGPMRIGKTTLVENVCQDEKVRNHFSLISVYSGNDLKDETEAGFKDKCVIKHRNNQALEKRLLVVIELLGDVDEEAWKRLCSCVRSMARGSKMIITSRSENIVRLGTTQPLRLKPLPVEAYWYLFKTSAFGSDDPRQHPKLASIALEIVDLMQGSFIIMSIAADILRANFNTQSWSMVLTRSRRYVQKNASLIGEHPDDVKVKDHPRFTCNVVEEKLDKCFMLHDIYQRGSAHKEVPQISFLDLLAGHARPPSGEYEILFWKSRIPPYFNYICRCEVRDM